MQNLSDVQPQAEELFPLSHAQLRIWYTARLHENSAIANIAACIRYPSVLDFNLLERAINNVLRRNSGLRLRMREITTPEGVEPRQFVLPFHERQFDCKDFSERDEEAFAEWMKEEAARPFELFDQDLFRFTQVKINTKESGYILVLHHTIGDGWTFSRVMDEIDETYRTLAAGSVPDQQPAPSYQNVVQAEQNWLATPDAEKAREYWLNKLLPLPDEASLVFSGKRSNGIKAGSITLAFAESTRKNLHQLMDSSRLSRFSIIAAAYSAVIHKLTAKDDLCIATVSHNRSTPEEKATAGMFVSTIPLRLNVKGSQTFLELCKDLSRELKHTLVKGRKYPFDMISREIKQQAGTDPAYLLAHSIVDHPDFSAPYRFDYCFSGEEVSQLDIHLNVANLDKDGILELTFNYQLEVFAPEEIITIFQALEAVLAQGCSAPDKSVAELELVSDEAKNQLLHGFNATSMPFQEQSTIHELFEQQVSCNPEKTALVFQDQHLSYAALNQAANRLAHHLRQAGVQPDEPVGLLADRSVATIISILAILKAGAAWLPLDPDYPASRTKAVLDESGARFLVLHPPLQAPEGFQGKLIDSEAVFAAAGADDTNFPSPSGPRNLAYLIFTSGSTGKPKGVMIEHRSVVNYLTWHIANYGLGASDKVAAHASFSFDASIPQVLSPLLCGAELHLIAQDIRMLPGELNSYFEAQGITHADLPTKFAEQFMLTEKNHSLRSITTGGEKLRQYRLGEYRLVDEYGPTEYTVSATSFEVDRQYETTPIGKPVANTCAVILDAYDRLQPIGVPGELCLSGAGLARGYFNRPDLTAERFVPNPHLPGQLMYRTGDLARWLPEGVLEFAGRKDTQVKMRGFRIEPGEIEALLKEHSDVDDAVVLCSKNAAGADFLSAHLVLGGTTITSGQYRYRLVTTVQQPDLEYLMDIEHAVSWPAFFAGDAINRTYWHKLYQTFPDLQFVLLQDDQIVMVGNMAPLYWDGDDQSIPTGWDCAIEQAFLDHEKGLQPNTVCVFAGVVSRSMQGRNASYDLIAAMARITNQLGFTHLLAPVRPTLKPRYPHMPLNEYAALKRDGDGLPFDPWLRVHTKLGGRVAVCTEQSQLVEGTVAQWQEWTGLSFPESGEYEVEGALQPVRIDLEQDYGVYYDQAVWYEHNLSLYNDNLPNLTRPEELRSYLAARLPDYMVPSRYSMVGQIPLTPNGKVDQKALLAMLPGEQAAANRVAPRTERERVLSDIWKQVLKVDEVGVDDNFFQLGGDSIMCIQVLCSALAAGMRLRSAQFYECPTISGMAASAEDVDQTKNPVRDASGTAPLIPIQQWFFDLGLAEPGHFNQGFCLIPAEPLLPEQLQQALQKTLQHHDAFRLRYCRQSAAGWQQQYAEPNSPLMRFESATLAGIDAAADAEQRAALMGRLQQPFDLEHGPLCAALLLTLPNGSQQLFMAIHHLVVDMVSWRILLQDLETTYRAVANNQKPVLPMAAAIFAQWGEALGQYATEQVLLRQRSYWQQVIEDAPQLATDHQAALPTLAETELMQIKLPQSATAPLLESSAQLYGLRANDVLLTALALAIFRANGDAELLVDLEGHGREACISGAEASRTIGWFTSLFPVRLALPTQPDAELSCSWLLSCLFSVKERLRAIPDNGIGYGLLRYLAAESLPEVTPGVSFNFLGELPGAATEDFWSIATDFPVELVSTKNQMPHLLEIDGYVVNGCLGFMLRFSKVHFESSTVERWAELFKDSLEQLASHFSKVASRTDNLRAAYSPSDFPLARLTQQQVDQLTAAGDVTNIYRLSPLQAGMLFHTLLHPDSGEYLNQTCWRFKEAVDAGLLQQAWQTLMNRHEVFRTGFAWEGLEEPLQLVHNTVALKWRELDWTDANDAEFEQRLQTLLADDRSSGFDLRDPGLSRAVLIRRRGGDSFVWTDHHILTDGWAVPLLIDELDELYAAARSQRAPLLAVAPPFWRMIEWLGKQNRGEALQFWKKQLADLNAPTSIGIEKSGVSHMDRHLAADLDEISAVVPDLLNQAILGFARKNGCTLNAVLMAAWSVALAVTSGSREAVFGMVASGRPEQLAGVERIVGLFIATAPIRIRLDNALTATEAIMQIQELSRGASQFSHIGIDAIRSASGIRPPTPLFNTIFALENYPVSEFGSRQNGLRLGDISSIERADMPLSLILFPGKQLELKAVYNRNLVETHGIHLLLRLFQAALQEIVSHPEQHLAAVAELLSETMLNSIPAASRADQYPLTPLQEKILIIEAGGIAGTTHNMPFKITWDGPLSLRRMSAALEQMATRHAALRSSFVVDKPEAGQIVHPFIKLKRPLLQADDAALDQIQEEFVRPFAINGQAPLFRVQMVRTAPERCHLLFDFHRLIFDPASFDLFMNELLALYRGEELAPPLVQFGDYVEWQRSLLGLARFRGQERFWQETLGDEPPALNLLPDRPRTMESGYQAGQQLFSLTASETGRLLQLGNSSGGGLQAVMLAAIALLLAEQADTNDVVVGIPVSHRNLPDTGGIIGSLETTVPFKNRIDRDSTIAAFVAQTGQLLLEAERHSDYPVESLYRSLGFAREPGRDPMFDTGFRLLDDIAKGAVVCEDGTLQITRLASNSVLFDLEFLAELQEEQLVCTCNYRQSLFNAATIERLGQRLQLVLAAFSASTETRIRDINLLPDTEKQTLLVQFNATEVPHNLDQTIHSLIERHAATAPDHTALIFHDRTMSYGELNRRADRLAAELRRHGASPDQLIGILAEPSLEMIVALLGVLKSGAGFVPLDAAYPADRIAFILGDCKARLLVTQQHLANQVEFDGAVITVICDDPDPAETASASPCPASPYHLAYAVYTSGSTGQPKGAMIEHRSLVNMTLWSIRFHGLSTADAVAKYLSFGFDASMYEIFPTLCSGATLCLVPQEIRLSIRDLNNYFEQHKVSVAVFPTAFGEQFLNLADNHSLRWMVCGGDRLRRQTTSSLVLSNAYGPTEYTVSTSEFVVDRIYDNIPIGAPIDNTRVYIIDKDLRLKPLGAPGELCIAGAGVARGYINRPELDAEKFIADPFRPGERMYRTGDLARWLPNGVLEFLGRIDFQVKIRGYRIEPGEVEKVIMAASGVSDAFVLAAPDHTGQKELRAYYTADGELEPAELRSMLAKQLPEYMLPAHLIRLEVMPLNPNGKVDRKQLPQPVRETTDDGETSGPFSARETLIAQVWCKHLGLERIGRDDNFFDMGGDSLKAVVVAAELQQQLDLAVSDLFTYQTVAKLAAHCSDSSDTLLSTLRQVHQLLQHPPQTPAKEQQALEAAQQEYLSKTKEYASIDLSAEYQPKVLLLTGATGHVGAYLLRDLLEQTNASLRLIVRGENQPAAQARLLERLTYYFGETFVAEASKRLTVYRGDISLPKLGLTPEVYAELAQDVDTVINSAANAKHYGQRAEFESANLEGTRLLLEFAAAGNSKQFHQISTVSVAMGSVPDRSTLLYTEYDCDAGQNPESFYLETKLAADKLVLAARQQGLATSIYRLGNCTVCSRTGRFRHEVESNAFFLQIKAHLDLGLILNSGEAEDFSFVDTNTRAVVELLKRRNLVNETWHIRHPQQVPLAEFLADPDLGLRLMTADNEIFFERLEQLTSSSWFRPRVETLALHAGWVEATHQSITQTTVAYDKTDLVLERIGHCPAELKPEIFRQFISQMLVERAQRLAAVPAFSGLDSDTLQQLAGLGQPRYLADDEDIAWEGRPATGVHVVEDGHLELSRLSNDGWQGTIGICGPSDLIGLDQVATPGLSALTAVAVFGDAALLSFKAKDLARFCEQTPQAAIGLLKESQSRINKLEKLLVAMG